MQFESFQLHPQLLAGTRALGFQSPTPIQAEAIPWVLQDRDVLGLAQTGTGKTAAFALPILQRLSTGPRKRVRALVIAPTRELAGQIQDSFTQLGQHTPLRSTAIYGGVGLNPQIQTLRNGVEVVVACPGRLLDHLNRGTVDLRGVEVVVLDEADRMCDMGFLPDIRRIMKRLPKSRQTLLFSATMPDDIRRLVREMLREPVTVQVDRAAPATTVSHALYPVAPSHKTDLLLGLLRHTDTESVLVFTRTKHRAKRLAEKLSNSGYRATALQGNLSQNRRQQALDGFRDGTFQIMVATDIAARGIDVSTISHVINYDMPDTADAYTHRIGRTGRAAKTGDAFTLVTKEDEGLVRAIERALGSRVARRTLADFDYEASARGKADEFDRSKPTARAKPRPKPSGAKHTKRQTGSASRPAATAGETAEKTETRKTRRRFRSRRQAA